jgi:hypothetical protein
MMAGVVGRPTKYKEEYAEQAYNYCLLGAIDKQLAIFFSVDVSTIHQWKHDHPDFSDSIKKGKEVADLEVTQSLKKRASGMKLKKQTVKDGVIVETEDEIPPDTAAAIFWLKNRQPEFWRDKQDVEHSGKVEITSLGALIDELSEDES